LIDLSAPAERVIMRGPYITLETGIWAVTTQLRGAGAFRATPIIDCTEKSGTKIIRAKTKITADDDGVIRFQIELDHRAEQVEIRFWGGCSQPLFFELMQLQLITD
jgi:hypothetical protein